MLTVFGILFLGLFALDIFGEGYDLGETLIALFMHLIPSLLLLLALLIAWRWRVIGGILFLVLGKISVIFFNTLQDPITFGLVSLPVFIIGLLFIMDAYAATIDNRHRSWN